jgi:ribosomal protein S18 acetylase RimI-like enzyme
MNIRPAVVEDAPFAVEMLYETMGNFADALFGLGDHAFAMEKLSWFYSHSENQFTYKNAEILEIDNQPAGLLQAMTGGELARLVKPMTGQVFKIYGIIDGLRLVWRSLPLAFEKEAENDEYYISALAVARNFRKRGLGEALLRHADDTARKLGLGKCSLLVEIGNARAKALYEKMGYRVVGISTNYWMRKMLATPGSERMVKIL